MLTRVWVSHLLPTNFSMSRGLCDKYTDGMDGCGLCRNEGCTSSLPKRSELTSFEFRMNYDTKISMSVESQGNWYHFEFTGTCSPQCVENQGSVKGSDPICALPFFVSLSLSIALYNLRIWLRSSSSIKDYYLFFSISDSIIRYCTAINVCACVPGKTSLASLADINNLLIGNMHEWSSWIPPCTYTDSVHYCTFTRAHFQ